MVLSDTEAEIATAQQKERVKADADVTWEWGELPQVPYLVSFLFEYLRKQWQCKMRETASWALLDILATRLLQI